MESPTPDPDATLQTVDALGHAIDDALDWDVVEEQRALAQIESRMFARARDPVRLSRYLLLRPLGSGGTGVVYDGYDPELARRVAVKVLRAGRHDPESVLRSRMRFVREAQSIARLSHPHVIAVYDVGTYSADELTLGTREGLSAESAEDAGVFIVMELVDGQDLATWLDRQTRTWREVVDVFLLSGEGLAAAHAAGLVHRDFKPGNVLVGDNGQVKVVDFGLALTYGGDGSLGQGPDTPTPTPSELVSSSFSDDGDSAMLEKLTRTGVLLGTPAYMAPEQHRGEPADQKADQFAFCASLYRALYGEHAFAGRKLQALYQSKSKGEIRPVPDDRRVPQWVHRVVLRGLRADPAERFTSMEELLRALRADPLRRASRWARLATVPLALGAVAYAGYLATRPGEVIVEALAEGAAVSDAQVYIDEQRLEGGRGEVPAGVHAVRVLAPDYESAEAVVDVQRGGVHEVAVELRHEQGVFELELEPAGGHVLIDGQDYGSRLHKVSVDTGPHDLWLRHDGYVDERLRWVAKAGETQRGFVALRKALVWSRAASGSHLQAQWLGDVNGDSLDDLMQRRFNTLTAYDPWNDGDLWRITMMPNSIVRLCDVDGDGTLDVVELHPVEPRELRVYDGRWRGDRQPKPRWVVAAPESPQAEMATVGEVVCLPQHKGEGEGGSDLGVVGLWPRELVRIGSDGARRWSLPVDDELWAVAARDDGDGGTDLVAMGQEGIVAVGSDGTLRWSAALSVVVREGDAISERWAREVRRRATDGSLMLVTGPLDRARGDDVLALLPFKGPDDSASLVALAGGDGRALWRVDTSRIQALRPGQDRGDVNGDGADDVLVVEPAEPAMLTMLSGRTGKSLWTRPSTPLAKLLMTRPAPVVLLGTRRSGAEPGQRLELIDAMSGTPYAHHDLVGTNLGPAVPYDWDGDGRDDLVAGSKDGVLRAFDFRLQPLSTVPLRIPASQLDPSRDANHDGFFDLLLQARGPAVVVGPKVRWDRRPLDSIRATPVIEDLDGDGELELALFGTLANTNRLEIVDARTGEVEASSSRSGIVVIRPPVLVPTEQGFDLFAVGGGTLTRFSGIDASPLASYKTKTAYAAPTLADLDEDGTMEVVVATWGGPGEVLVLDAQSLELRWSRELGDNGSFGAPWVGDVDGDGEREVVVAGLDGRVVTMAADGEVEWATETGGRLNFKPTVADLESNGTLQILVTPHLPDDPLVVLEGKDGRERARWPEVATRRARPLVEDVDEDGRPEIFASSRFGGLFSLEGDGTVRWNYRFVDSGGYQAGGAGSPIVEDLDGDGRFEMIAGFEDGSLHVVDARDGTLVWRFRTGREEVEASPAVGDVDRDGRLEVFVAGHDRHLFCLEHSPTR